MGNKRHKKAVQRYPCHSCLEDRTSSQFPDYNPTNDCQHLINTCKQCLRQWIESQVEDSVFTPRCPQCDQNMTKIDVKMAVTEKTYKRYEDLERAHVATNTPGWRWCLAPGCRAGQIHERANEIPNADALDQELPSASPTTGASRFMDLMRTGVGNTVDAFKTQRAQEPVTEHDWPVVLRKPDICTCHECGAQACVPCDRPWHEGETCDEYKERIKDRLKEEDASLAFIEAQSRPCPKCKKHIQKNGGCSHMHCTQCNSQFCWSCMELINSNGRYCGCANPDFH